MTMPIAQFPKIVPPEVRITTTYVGADAQTVEQSVATPIEQQMSGVDNMNYMYSISGRRRVSWDRSSISTSRRIRTPI